ncbi:MAG: NUDIX domain-containing protein [Candidatus Nanopelagicales bacterium]
MRFSAGLLPVREGQGTSLEVFLVHMAGPYWAHKDDGAWSVAKGEYDPATEDPWEVAQREFDEEVGIPAPPGERWDLGETRMPSGKRVLTYAVADAGGSGVRVQQPVRDAMAPRVRAVDAIPGDRRRAVVHHG